MSILDGNTLRYLLQNSDSGSGGGGGTGIGNLGSLFGRRNPPVMPTPEQLAAFQAARHAAQATRRANHGHPGPVPTPVPTPTPTPVPTGPPPAPTTREGWLGAVNTQFQPGSEYSAVPSSLLDDAISSILQEQQGSAQQYLDRGKARGIFNDVGYNAGEAALGNEASVGRSDLSTLGSGVIDKYRTGLSHVADQAYSAASGYQPGLHFSLDPYINQYNDIKNRASLNGAGDLRSLIGGKNYFDFGSLSNRAGMAQGALNLRDTDVATAMAERRRRNLASRGLGSQGAF